jgi:serralysin
MATLTMSFPGEVYLPGYDFNPSLGELIDLTNSTVISSTSTRQVFQLQNGLRLELNGTGFTYDAGLNGTGGTLTSIRLLQGNGTTVIQTLTGLNIPFADAYDAAVAYDAWGSTLG